MKNALEGMTFLCQEGQCFERLVHRTWKVQFDITSEAYHNIYHDNITLLIN